MHPLQKELRGRVNDMSEQHAAEYSIPSALQARTM